MIKIGAVVAEFNFDITSMMLELAKEHAKFLDAEITEIIAVPGVYDMPIAIKKLLDDSRNYINNQDKSITYCSPEKNMLF